MVKFELDTSRVIYETDLYKVVVTPLPEDVLEGYGVINKETDVLEYSHSVQYYAQEWADMFTKILKGEAPGGPIPEEDLPEINLEDLN